MQRRRASASHCLPARGTVRPQHFCPASILCVHMHLPSPAPHPPLSFCSDGAADRAEQCYSSRRRRLRGWEHQITLAALRALSMWDARSLGGLNLSVLCLSRRGSQAGTAIPVALCTEHLKGTQTKRRCTGLPMRQAETCQGPDHSSEIHGNPDSRLEKQHSAEPARTAANTRPFGTR